MGELRTAEWSESTVEANWKIIVENYQECLHCPGVHPELVRIIPAHRRGSVIDDPDSWGVPLAEGATSLTLSGRSALPPLPGLRADDLDQCYGSYVFPNLIVDLSADCVTWDTIFPLAPGRVVMRGGYMFDPATIARDDFDPSGVIEFGDLVTRQDYEVCERVQKNMGSMAYAQGGVYAFHDRYAHAFIEQYLRAMKQAAAAP
jgi:Rieske 2Fe-2S family protein